MGTDGYEWVGDMNPNGFDLFIDDDEVYCGIAFVNGVGERCGREDPEGSWCAGCVELDEYRYGLASEGEATDVAVGLYRKAKGAV